MSSTPRLAVPLALLLAVACAPPAPPGGPAPRYAAHPGFDAYYYPGDAALLAWRAPASPYRWIGYYLPSPCHRETSWAGRRATIERLGWGIAVLYVGQQTWEGQPPPPPPPPAAADTGAADTTAAAAPPPPPACAPSQLTPERGAADGADAAARAAAEGFAPGTVLYLNVERMERVTPAMDAYVRAWMGAVAGDGRYAAGLYAHTRNAAELHAAARAALAAAGAGEPRVWVAGGTGFDVARAPTDVGHAFAWIWQGRLDVAETWNGVTLRVDANVARTPSPSAPEPSPP